MISIIHRARERVKGIIRLFHGKDESKRLKTHFARGSTGTFGLKVSTAGLAFLISLILARLLGATGYGAYAYALSWVRLLVIPAILGLDKLLVREIASYQTQSLWGRMRGLLRRSNQGVLIASIALGIVAAVVGWALRERLGSQMVTTLWITLIIIPLYAFIRVKQAVLQGLQKIVRGQLPEMLIQPLLLLILIGVAYLLFKQNLNPQLAAGMHAVTAAIALGISVILLTKALPKDVKRATPEYQTRTWLRSAWPLLFASGMYIINVRVGAIMLGSMKGAEAAGIYTIADQGAILIIYILTAVNAPLAPTIAELYAIRDMERLQRVVTKSARVIFLLSLPIALTLIIFGHWFLLLFGSEFVRGEPALILLCIAQFATAAAGPVTLLLTMTGYEREAARGVTISALLNILLNLLLTPTWGIEGTAVAFAISTITWNVLLVYWVRKRLDIHPTALGIVHLRRNTK
ncbi:flippase [bacterium]|nr:flippase [bacterium]